MITGGGALAVVLGGGLAWLLTDDDPPDGASSSGDASDAAATSTDTLPAPTGDAPTFDDVDPGIIAVGTAYVAAYPDDDLPSLLADLPTDSDDPIADAATTTAEEFAAGDTVVIDGWVLARSEARASALIALACAGDRC